MSNEPNRPNEENELESLGVRKNSTWLWMDPLGRFLNNTQPAILLIVGAMAIVLAGIAAYLGIKSGISVPNGFTQSNNHVAYTSSSRPAQSGLAPVMSFAAFLLGIIGALLPTWAVGRLIADAISKGATHD